MFIKIYSFCEHAIKKQNHNIVSCVDWAIKRKHIPTNTASKPQRGYSAKTP